METMSFRNNTSSNIARTNTNYNKQITNTLSSIDLRKSNVDIVKNKVSSSKLNNIFSNLHKRNSLQTNKLFPDENFIGDDFKIYANFAINSNKEFDTPNEGDIPLSIINEIGELLMKDFPNENDLKTKNVSDIIEETHNKVKENKTLIKMVGQLKYLKIEMINTKDKCLAFWLNCFNYLLLFAIFYKKWNIDGEKVWKKFFKNVKFNIGGKNYSFNDIQYIIFKKPSFISSSYKAPDEIKQLNIDKISGEKKFDDYLQETVINKVSDFRMFFNNWEKSIRDTIQMLNQSLSGIDFNTAPCTYIQLVNSRRINTDIAEFRRVLENAIPNIHEINSTIDGKQTHFERKIQPLMEQLKNEQWRRKVMDVRSWYSYKAEEFFKESGQKFKTYESMGQLSGGEKAQLTYTILGSAIAYQFGLTKDGLQAKSLRFIAIDEAFKAQDEDKARYLISLCKQLNLQLLVVTPSDNIHIVENDISFVHYVERSGNESRLFDMPIEIFKQEREKYQANDYAN